jgi:hypothetical protein
MTEYRCPNCGSKNLAADVEMATMANPNDDIRNESDHWLNTDARMNLDWEWSRNGQGYAECLDCTRDGTLESFETNE